MQIRAILLFASTQPISFSRTPSKITETAHCRHNNRLDAIVIQLMLGEYVRYAYIKPGSPKKKLGKCYKMQGCLQVRGSNPNVQKREHRNFSEKARGTPRAIPGPPIGIQSMCCCWCCGRSSSVGRTLRAAVSGRKSSDESNPQDLRPSTGSS